MLRLFSKVRHSLVKSDRMRAYYGYAFGEIILVVVGILIALQINNWNEQRIENKHLKQLFIAIKHNVEEDLVDLEASVEQREKLREVNQQAALALLKEEHDIELYTKASRFVFEYYFTRHDSGYQALINSGLMSNISNTPIERALYAYYKALDKLYKAEVSYNEFIENIELQWRLNYPSIKFGYISRSMFSRSLIEEPLKSELKARKDELLPYFLSNEFQAGVLRTSVTGGARSKASIDAAKLLLEEIDRFIADEN